MRIPSTLAVLIVACFALGGCGTLGGKSADKVQLVDRDGVDMIAAPAGHVSVLMKDGKSSERVCGGRMPDAILDSAVGLSLPGKGIGVGTTNTDLALGGRSPQVLIVREVLYRLCEISLNANLQSKDMVELYKDTLPIVTQALASTATGTSSAAIVGQTPNVPATATGAPVEPAGQGNPPYSPANLPDSSYSQGGISPVGGAMPGGGISPAGGMPTDSGVVPAGAGGITPVGGPSPGAAVPGAGGTTPMVTPGSPASPSSAPGDSSAVPQN